MWIVVAVAVVFGVIVTVCSVDLLRFQFTTWPDPGEHAPLKDTIFCIAWIQTLFSWVVVVYALMGLSISSLLGVLAASFVASCLLGRLIGSMLADHKVELWDELWRQKRARGRIDAAYEAKNVDWLRDLARSEQSVYRDYARSLLDRLLEELNGPVPYQEKLEFPEV